MATPERTPSGLMLEDGYQCIIKMANAPTIALWEKSVTPPGFDGGGKIDITTMHNATLKTYAAQSLREMTDGSMTVAYDPAVLSDIISQINVNQLFTLYWPNDDTWTFYANLQSFTPNELTIGEQPTAQCIIAPLNVDPSDGSESDPSWTAAA